MKSLRSFILGLVAITAGIAISLFAPAVFMGPSQAEAVVIITNTCTSTWQVAGAVPVLSGFDTVMINVEDETPIAPVSWIAGVHIQVSTLETQVLFTFSSDTITDAYGLVKIRPDGTSETIIITGSTTYLDTDVAGDTIYYYSVFGLRTGAETGAMSDSVAVGIASDGLILGGSMSNSTSIEINSREDTRASVLITNPDIAFGAEQGLLKITMKRIILAQLPVPAWAKNGIASAYQVSCERWPVTTPAVYVSQFAAPIQLTLAYDVLRNKVTGTNVKTDDILHRLSNFWWNGSSWSRMVSTANTAGQVFASQTYHFSYFSIADVRAQQIPGFPGYGAEPNPFSPNGDGYNDQAYFKFPNENSEAGVFMILDLKGAVVYKADILAGQTWTSWSGYYNVAGGGKSDIAEAGAYIWQAKVGGKAYNGIVVLVK